ncbi:MAG: hypothetical protein J4203_04095 [Candidatus Diapherotrites archaeon]|uniref:Uncharacterized protein n=1 Tax=Candidatus Iainarchaeum sp. TaxID=3101447 RepID=A0A8T4L6Y0_9ARCH|nr:hypothetical protein [Candidatus Diapherotrites archaeon]
MKPVHILALLLLLVALAGCSQEPEKKAPVPEATPLPELGQELIPQKYLKDLGVCLKYLDSIDKCVYNRATVLRVGQLCEPIRGQELREACFLEIAPLVGVKNLCLQAGSKREDCFEKMALARNNPEECLAIEAGERRDICLKNLAVRAQNPEFCEGLEEAGRRDTCYAKTAVDSNNLAACELIMNEANQQNCAKIVGQLLGIEEHCSRGVPEGDACLLAAAQRSNKQALCPEIMDSTKESECYAFFGKKNADKHACLQASGRQRDECLVEVAMQSKDASLCLPVQDAGLRAGCFGGTAREGANQLVLRKLNGFCAGMAGEARNPCEAASAAYAFTVDYCDAVSDQNRLPCLKELDALIHEPVLCAKFPEGTDKAGCIISAAANEGRVEVCNGLREKFQKSECIKEVAVSSRSERTCENIELAGGGAQIRYDCLERVAVKKGDYTICLDIKFKEQLGECIGQIAVAKKDALLCGETPNAALSEKDPYLARENCYRYVAGKTKDAGLCDQVQNAGRKEKCLAQLG